MTKFDKKIRELSREPEIPASYDEKIDEILKSIAGKEEKPRKKRNKKVVFRVAVCMLVVAACLIFLDTLYVEADIFDVFKRTILDFLGQGTQEDVKELGVESSSAAVAAKPDLMIELQETVIGSHSIYLLVRIIAPADIEFAGNLSFDYFCFCKGENYNNNQLLSGTRACELLEVGKEKKNVATYVVSMVSDEELEEGGMVTVCFKDLEADPYSDNPQLLVEGLWSVTFPLERTITGHITIEGTPDMTFSFVDTTALLAELELTPSGMVVLSDVSAFPYDELAISDTRIDIKLLMLDGSELVIQSRDPQEEGYIQGGSSSFEEKDGKSFQQDIIEFKNLIDISKVYGIYIEDLYISVK